MSTDNQQGRTKYRLNYSIFIGTWHMFRESNWKERNHIFEASSDEEAILKAKAFLYDQDVRSDERPKLKGLVKISQEAVEEKVTEISLG